MNKKVLCMIAGSSLISACATAPMYAPAMPSGDPGRFSYTRIHCTQDNESHFETVTVDLARVDAAPPALPFFAKGAPATRAAFAAFESGWGSQDLKARKFHPTPAAQYVIYLEGEMSITTSDGETRRFGPGAVLRVEDTSPCKGHISVVGDRPSFTMVVR